MTENTIELLKTSSTPQSLIMIRKLEEKVVRYEKEKAEIKTKAESFEKEYEAINLFDDQFDMTDAFLTIAIAMFGITLG